MVKQMPANLVQRADGTLYDSLSVRIKRLASLYRSGVPTNKIFARMYVRQVEMNTNGAIGFLARLLPDYTDEQLTDTVADMVARYLDRK